MTKEEKIIPPYMQQNIDRHRKRKKLDEIIARVNYIYEKVLNGQVIGQDIVEVIEKLERFKEEEL